MLDGLRELLQVSIGAEYDREVCGCINCLQGSKRTKLLRYFEYKASSKPIKYNEEMSRSFSVQICNIRREVREGVSEYFAYKYGE